MTTTTPSAWRLLASPAFFGRFFEAEIEDSPPEPEPWTPPLAGFDEEVWGRGKLADPSLVLP